MADGRIVFPDDVQRTKRECASRSNRKPQTPDETNGAMADNDRVVFPDEVEDSKPKVQENEETDTNSIEQPPIEGGAVVRNMIVAPGNCPPGQTRGADGVCRDIF